MKMSKLITAVGLIALVVALIIAGPLLLIWALNTLFPVLAIPYTIWTWLAALILGATVSPTVKVKR
jgi:hypothetical protein